LSNLLALQASQKKALKLPLRRSWLFTTSYSSFMCTLQGMDAQTLSNVQFVTAVLFTAIAAWLVKVGLNGWKARAIFVKLRRDGQVSREENCSSYVVCNYLFSFFADDWETKANAKA
jgi:hypothetical protein